MTNNTRSVTVPEYINPVGTVGNCVIQDVNGVNTIIRNNLEPNIQSTLEVGLTRIGTNDTYSDLSTFSNNSLANTSQYYCIGQNNAGTTYINSWTGQINLRKKNSDT